jgi:hypothetical protein
MPMISGFLPSVSVPRWGRVSVCSLWVRIELLAFHFAYHSWRSAVTVGTATTFPPRDLTAAS